MLVCVVSVLGVGVLGISSCKNTQKPADANKVATGDFEAFYQRFHSDTTFQVAHVLFPLEGFPDNADSTMLAERTFRWTPENWVIHRPLSGKGMRQELVPISDEVIIERVVDDKTNYGLERRFAKLQGTWYLIYYSGMNPRER